MILVTVGTHHQPFDRLVEAADQLARAGEEVFVQWGTARAPRVAAGEAWLTPERLEALADEAQVIVTHAGPASLFLAWDRGLLPVVVPRQPDLGEHVDDHQLRFAEHLGGRALVVLDTSRLHEAVATARDTVRGAEPRSDRREEFSRRLAALGDALVTGARARRRGTLARLATWVRASWR